MDLGLAPARSEASSEDNLRGDVVEALDELLSELETSIGTETTDAMLIVEPTRLFLSRF